MLFQLYYQKLLRIYQSTHDYQKIFIQKPIIQTRLNKIAHLISSQGMVECEQQVINTHNFIMTQNPEHSRSRLQLNELQLSGYSNHLNNSSAKMLYSMPRNPRFKPPPLDDSKFYQLPSQLSGRSASFGFGNKLDFGKLVNRTPSPDAYHLQGDFERRRSNAIAIGLGRELVKAVSVFDERSFKVPGPGSYDAKDLPSQQKVGLSGRVPDLSTKWIREVPGPGTYKTMELLDKNLKSNVSKFASCRAGRFSKGEQRGDFERMVRKRNVPGPGEYKTIDHSKAEKFAQHKGRSFSKSSRPSIANKSCAPGPGSYRHFSDFIQ